MMTNQKCVTAVPPKCVYINIYVYLNPLELQIIVCMML